MNKNNNAVDAASFALKLEAFVDHLQSACNQSIKGSRLEPAVVSTIPGRRYVKVIRTNRDRKYDAAGKVIAVVDGQRSACCFVDKVNGDILKAATWKAPVTKDSRGNIFNSVLPGDAHGGFYTTSPNVIVGNREDVNAVFTPATTVLKAGPVSADVVASLDALFA